MAKYLLQVSFTLDGIRGVGAQGGSARRDAAEEAIQSVGGKLEAFYFAFGETDVFVVADLPDNKSAAALVLHVTAAGGASVRTVPLLTPQEIDAAVAQPVAYRPPGT
ncbi:MAG TPA: GYD domain-containing protein [Acidimicrobiales bacterium]|nr:GYD domain-containing protein [Acidimicrobiales bacterium]